MINNLDDIISELIKFDQKLREEHIKLHKGGHEEVKLKLEVIKTLISTIERILASSQNKS